MPTPVYVSPFTGTVVTQTQVSYEYITLDYSIPLFWPATTPDNEYPLARIIDVEPQSAGLYVDLPAANQGTRGADSLIRNQGGFSFTVYNYTHGQSFVIAPGQSFYFYLNNNNSEGGYWQSVQFGTGTSTADANALAGRGLEVRNGLLWVAPTVIDVTSSFTLTNNNSTNVYVWQSGSGTITLPTAASLGTGWFIGFRNNGTGALTFQTQGASNINASGSTSFTANPSESGYVVFNVTTGDFATVGVAPPNVVTFTSSVYDVDAAASPLDLTAYAPIIQKYVALTGTRSTNLSVEFPPITQIYVLVNDTGQAGYNLVFNVQGSASPPVTLADGQIVTVLSDGTTLTVVSQASVTGVFSANNGTAASPSFRFTSNTSTGMYLANPNVLGLTANGTAMMTLDNSAPGSPITTINGQLNAGSIQGGTF